VTVIGYILIHHVSTEKLFDRGDGETDDNESKELHDILVQLLDNPDDHTENCVLLSSILTGIRY
jgi:hypothetical protein